MSPAPSPSPRPRRSRNRAAYVAEFLLGRYCASVDDEEIAEGLKIVERQLGEKIVRAGEHELFKARAKDKGHVKLIDIITARLDAGSDSFLATLPVLGCVSSLRRSAQWIAGQIVRRFPAG
jgi:predicted ATP-dependent Lon-type protease